MRKLFEQPEEEIVKETGKSILPIIAGLSDDAIIIAQRMGLFKKLKKKYNEIMDPREKENISNQLNLVKIDIDKKKKNYDFKKKKIEILKSERGR